MDTRRIGSLEVSVIAMGCNNFGQRFAEEQTAEVVHAALDAGVTYFDTAESYGDGRSEECLGYALKGHRDRAIVATKYDGPATSAREHAEASLRRLNVDYIDLFTHHHPVPEVPVQETIEALRNLVKEGKIREFGCSNLTLEQLQEAQAAAKPGEQGFVSLQNDYNLLNRKMEVEVLPACIAGDTAFTAYFPLYHGFLTGKYHRGVEFPEKTRLTTASEIRKGAVFTDAHYDVTEALEAFAKERGHTVLDVAIARLLAQPGVTAVIPGATTASHARQNAAAADWHLAPEEIGAIDEIAPSVADCPNTPSRSNGYP